MGPKVCPSFSIYLPFRSEVAQTTLWIYHIIDSIRMYGAINGYTTETYETLHKDFVKIPYRSSNKKNVETQLLQIVSI